MRVKVAFGFCFAMAAAAFASDGQFSIQKDGFRIGEEIKIDAMTAIGVLDQKMLSIAPEKVVVTDKIFMRRKINGKLYGIYEGPLNPVPYRHFFAFDLAANKITLQEAMGLKFYSTRRAKPYRDEAELYFDGERIYSPHVPVLYFVKNGEWERLEAILAPGIVSIVSNNPDAQVAHNGKKHSLPQEFFPVDAGLYFTEVSAPDYFTYVDAVKIVPNKVTTLRVNPMKDYGTKVSFFPKVHENDIAAADSLEKLEALYDSFRADSLAVLDTLSGGNFRDVYPAKKIFDLVDSAKYAAYSKAYDSLYNVALDSWLNRRLSPVTEMSAAFAKRFAAMQTPEVKLQVVPVGLKIFRNKDAKVPETAPAAPVDSTKKADSTATDSTALVQTPAPSRPVADSIQLTVKSADGRFDFVWVGTVENAVLDTVIEALTKDAETKVLAKLANNKPVWMYDSSKAITRKHYRYVGLSFMVRGLEINGVGKFVLPQAVLAEKEVQEWLHPETVVKQDSVKPVAVPVDTVKKDSVRLPPQWGSVVKLDSASFRYHGKVVGISGFYIQTKEVSQQEYRNNIVTYHLKQKDRSTYEGGNRPVHNITWDMAREYCQTLGGDLPTEAQWEYAARAGGNDGFVWDALGGKVDDYAIYRENAGKDQKGPQDCGSKKPNAWGIYDMHGNVAEWTRDSYSWFSFYDEDVNPTGALLGYTKVFKGGSFDDKVKYLNATARDDEDPRYWSENIGFRCMFPLK